jgi:membrane associated rhomboid family serine protease
MSLVPAGEEPALPDSPHAVPERPPEPRPFATWALLAANVAMFAGEVAWGGSESATTLHRMGANLGRSALLTEPWRVVSSAFLHIGPLHLAFNMWALSVFGAWLERSLGAARFVTLYGLSAVTGGLASALVKETELAAGASGAVWGLMLAQIVIVLRLRRRLGPERVPVSSSAIAQPLLINLVYSLQPGIDLSAHLGGGLGGAAIGGLIALPLAPNARAWRPLAAASVLLMAASVAAALARGRPWELSDEPALVPTSVQGMPVRLPLPESLLASARVEDGETLYGAMPRDPLIVGLTHSTVDDPIPADELRATFEQWISDPEFNPPPAGLKAEGSSRVVNLRDFPAVYRVATAPGGARVHSWIVLDGPSVVHLDVVTHPNTPAAWRELPDVIAHGLEIDRGGVR